jgi:hypothetical protein
MNHSTSQNEFGIPNRFHFMSPTSRQIKKELRPLLLAEDFPERLGELLRYPPRQSVSPLFGFLCHHEPLLRWRAVTAMGVAVARLAEEDLESARVIMRRMMWNLNDESGGIGWGLPEAMGEIMARHGKLAREYGCILLSYVQEEGNPLQFAELERGALWGLARLAEARPELFHGNGGETRANSHSSADSREGSFCDTGGSQAGMLSGAAGAARAYVDSPDAESRAYAARLLGFAGSPADRSALESLLDDPTEIPFYHAGDIHCRRTSDFAREALERLQS